MWPNARYFAVPVVVIVGLTVLLLAWSCVAGVQPVEAAPYFRLVDPAHPRPLAGVYADPFGSEAPDAGVALPLVLHRAGEGGAIIRSIQVDWSPLALGAGRSAGGSAFLALGPIANLAPAVKGLALAGLDALAPGGLPNLRHFLAPVPGSSGIDAAVSFGPAWQFKLVESGRWRDPDAWRGRLSVFFGAAIQF